MLRQLSSIDQLLIRRMLCINRLEELFVNDDENFIC